MAKDDMPARPLRVGIVGLGRIARKMAATLRAMDGACLQAVASRDPLRSAGFAQEFGVPSHYTGYRGLLEDPLVDLVYIATPHSHHLECALEAIAHGKPCLVEKSMTANAKEARELFDAADKAGVFVCEAVWTRFLPMARTLAEIVARRPVGEIRMVNANMGYPMLEKERIVRRELCGGALLDVGIYTIEFARTVTQSPVTERSSLCTLSGQGIDLQESVSLRCADGTLLSLQASAFSRTDLQGMIYCSDGVIISDSILNPGVIRVMDSSMRLLEEHRAPAQLTGYEYEVLACRDAITAGLTECSQMPHSETLWVMELMDALRADWGVRYPADDIL